jgi:hypothetical protein
MDGKLIIYLISILLGAVMVLAGLIVENYFSGFVIFIGIVIAFSSLFGVGVHRNDD